MLYYKISFLKIEDMTRAKALIIWSIVGLFIIICIVVSYVFGYISTNILITISLAFVALSTSIILMIVRKLPQENRQDI
ncbi:hypothetical protein HMPREF3202_02360 [Prevotella bivia]|uniref:Uncharacterized protein n=1 Tax=Prevotella bivia TaxID=28125 RepID=A0A137SQB5_9BACT|nr:hypothetical protein HMPREF3202_02360 [Prevotella bivia]